MSTESKVIVTIATDGKMRFIYNDRLAGLLKTGKAQVTRASNVEPAPGGGWTADMSPIGADVILGPFKFRSEALAAETQWLEQNIL